MFLGQTIKMCINNVLSNKLRSFLTMLGIIIGISSVIILVGFTQGTSDDINSSIQSLGANILKVNIYNDDDESLTYQEVSEPEFNFVEDTVLISQSRVNARTDKSSSSYTLIGTSSNYVGINKIGIQSGRDLGDLDIENTSQVALIGSNVANALYENEDPINQKILLNNNYYTVVGVISGSGTSSLDSDSSIIVPITSFGKTLDNDTISSMYFVADKSVSNTQSIEPLAISSLASLISSENIEVVSEDTLSDTVNEVDEMTQILILLVGIISLVVSGIGVMNMMIVSVSERTREIGVRKAIGATNFDILLQFLIEAIVITTIGGILGVILGCGFKIISNMMGISFTIDLQVVIISGIFSMMIGVVFGIIPALKASKLKPVDALKYE